MKHSKLKQSITIILAVFLAITLLGALGIWLYQRDQAAKDAYRCYVFEDLLQPGMTREQVEDISV